MAFAFVPLRLTAADLAAAIRASVEGPVVPRLSDCPPLRLAATVAGFYGVALVYGVEIAPGIALAMAGGRCSWS